MVGGEGRGRGEKGVWWRVELVGGEGVGEGVVEVRVHRVLRAVMHS